VTRRTHLVPWRRAGDATDRDVDADEVVRDTGWVFNNVTGDGLTLADFVATGEREVRRYLRVLGLDSPGLADARLLELGCGIGRMTAPFTRRVGTVLAADVDPAFLERCRETVARHGDPARLRTARVVDGRRIDAPDAGVDLAFSYLTLQHCAPDVAIALAREAVRATRPGGTVALNFRGRLRGDAALLALGALVRLAWRVPVLGPRAARWRWAARLGWQANRLGAREVLDALGARLAEPRVFVADKRGATPQADPRARVAALPRLHRGHWWLVARVA
jgi:SAM-dependent methyltransferase